MLYIFCLLRHKSLFLVTRIFLFYIHFRKQEMHYCSDDAPKCGKRNVRPNKNASENVASNKIFHSDEQVSSLLSTKKNYHSND